MAQMGNTQTVALQLEKVRDKLPLLYEREDIFITKIQKKGSAEKVSTRAMRLPLQIRPGGKAGQTSMDGADLGRGSGTQYQFAQITPIFFRFAVEITKLVEYATNNQEKAIENAAKKEVKNGMVQFRNFLDRLAMTAGDGILGEIETGTVVGNAFTMASPDRANLLYFNQQIQFVNSARTIIRGSAEITFLNYETGEVEVDAMPAGVIDTDAVMVDGVTVPSPSSLKGVKYHQSNAATGLWLNLDRALFPEIRTPRVNAASAALTPAPIRLALNKIRQALGIEAAKTGDLMVLTNLAQEDAYESLGIQISEIIKQGNDKQGLDLFFNGNKTMSGVPLLANTHADQTRLDFLSLKHWGRAVIQEIDYYEVGGQTVFPVYGASGGLASAYLFYFVTGFDIWTDSPRSGSYIDNLATPDGY